MSAYTFFPFPFLPFDRRLFLPTAMLQRTPESSCPRRAPQQQRGWLRPERGDYHDALHVKRNSVIAIITEPSGGIAPQGYAHLKMLARTSRLPGGRDGTRYGLSRSSPRSYLTHHMQRISAGIVRANARNILAQVVGVKQRAAVSRV